MPQISTEDSGILQLTKNAKTNNDIAGYHLVSRGVNIHTFRWSACVKMAQKDLHITQKTSCLNFKYVIIAT